MYRLNSKVFRVGNVVIHPKKTTCTHILLTLFTLLCILIVCYQGRPNLWYAACEKHIDKPLFIDTIDWNPAQLRNLKFVKYSTAWNEYNLDQIQCFPINDFGISDRLTLRSFRFRHICPAAEHLSLKGFVSKIAFASYEEGVLFNLARRYVELYPDTVVLDIGANIGAMSIPLANAFPTVKVIAIEPVIKNVRLLTKSIILNKLEERILLLVHALSDKAYETVQMVSYDSKLTWSRMNKPGAVLPPNRTLDHFENNITTITFNEILPLVKPFQRCLVKIDIEGAECIAVTKMRAFLNGIHVPMIIMETDKITKVDAACVEAAFTLLTEYGYVPYSDQWNYLQGKLDWRSFKNWKHINTIWAKQC